MEKTHKQSPIISVEGFASVMGNASSSMKTAVWTTVILLISICLSLVCFIPVARADSSTALRAGQATSITSQSSEIVESGTWGDSVDGCPWALDSEGLLIVSAGTGGTLAPSNYCSPWKDHADQVKKIVFEDGVIFPGNVSWLCAQMTALEAVEFRNVDASAVTKMDDMFSYCTSLVSLDFTTFRATNVTSMEGMLSNCKSLESVKFAGITTRDVSDMSYLFSHCSSLTELDLSGFNTAQVTDMEGMFYGCSSLTQLNLSSFNTASVTTMYKMFGDCSNLTSLNLSSFNTENVTNMHSMFNGCSALGSINLSNFDTSNVVDSGLADIFEDCSSLTEIDLSGFHTSKAKDLGGMFRGCASLTSIDVSKFDTSNATSLSGMFSECSNLTEIDISNFNTTKLQSINGLCYECSKLATIVFPEDIDTSRVRNFNHMFYGCESLTELDLSGFDTSSGENFDNMFANCTSLVTLDISNFDTTKANDRNPGLGFMFIGCESLGYVTVGPNTFACIYQSGFDSQEGYVWKGPGGVFSSVVSAQGEEMAGLYEKVKQRNIADATVTGIEDKVYTGQAYHQDPVVTYDGELLVEGTDYYVSYRNETEVGTADITLLGMGLYNGYNNVHYNITAPSKSPSTVTLSAKTATYTGKAVAIGRASVKGSTGEVTYRYYSDAKCTKQVAASKVVNAGTYYARATVAEDDTYKAATSRAAKLVISPAPISKAKLALAYTAKTYTGTALKPALKTASFNGAALKKGTDYSLAYKANKAVGTATVTVKGLGNFAGSKKLTFTVRMPKPTVSLAAHAGKLTSGQKGIDVSWKMRPMPPAAQVTGYVVQFSTSKAFPSGKTRTSAVTITASNKYKALYAKRTAVATGGTHFKMRANTVYYVRVKAYRKLGGKTYATWSAAAKCRTSK